MNEREQFLKNMALAGDPTVKSRVGVTYGLWQQYGDRLNWLEDFSEHVSVGVSRKSDHPAGSEKVDVWGCRWHYPLEAHDGQVIERPIESWSALRSYEPPRAEEFTDWEQAKENFARAKSEGRVAGGNTDHGFIFLRLCYLRGYENFMLDLADERPELRELIALVEEYWLEVCTRWVDAGADTIHFGDDLGLQHMLPMSPAKWREFIRPSYERIFRFCRSNGVHVSLHTDGYIVDIIPDLIECGVSQLNPQDFVNGLLSLERLAKGKTYICLDIDRQRVTVFGKPDEIEAHIRNCITTLGSEHGGLSMVWTTYQPTPIENIEACVRAMDTYATYWIGH